MMDTSVVNLNEVSNAMRQRIRDLRNGLLMVHKTLLDGERIAYERVHGAQSGGDLLQLAINHEQFGWLHQISELIVRIDEILEAAQPPASEKDAEAVIKEARGLLSPAENGDGFARKYYDALQRDPATALAHRELRPLLV